MVKRYKIYKYIKTYKIYVLYDSDVNSYLADSISSNERVTTIYYAFLGSCCSLPRLFLQRYCEIYLTAKAKTELTKHMKTVPLC